MAIASRSIHDCHGISIEIDMATVAIVDTSLMLTAIMDSIVMTIGSMLTATMTKNGTSMDRPEIANKQNMPSFLFILSIISIIVFIF